MGRMQNGGRYFLSDAVKWP